MEELREKFETAEGGSWVELRGGWEGGDGEGRKNPREEIERNLLRGCGGRS